MTLENILNIRILKLHKKYSEHNDKVLRFIHGVWIIGNLHLNVFRIDKYI